MCGIVGYVGKNAAVPYLLEGLSLLEYRGYDSAGIAVLQDDKIDVIKTGGRISELEKKVEASFPKTATVGIGHTRWATHGAPTERNAHPHLSQGGLFAVVHNGIIENYAELKEKLLKEGFRFSSDTDSEVIAQLLEKNYDGSFLGTVRKTVAALRGSYALAVLCRNEPQSIVCVGFESPLVLGKSEEGVFLASDSSALLRHTKDVFRLKNGESALLQNGTVSFFDPQGEPLQKQSVHIDRNAGDAEKNGFSHFMLKEIFEQPDAFRRTVAPFIKNDDIEFDGFSLSQEEAEKINRVIITACGSAYHVGIAGSLAVERLAKLPCTAEIASEFRYCDPVLDENTLVVLISQSGETADTLAALRMAKKKGARVLSIVNVPESTIANESENVIHTAAGPEIAVATTKAYCAQLGVIYLLALYLSQKRKLIDQNEKRVFLHEIRELPQKLTQALENSDAAKALSKPLALLEHIYFIGRQSDYAAATEASLKMKEISYIHCEAYAAGELKHGTISLIENGTLVVACACSDRLFEKTVSNIREVKARGARVLAVTTEKHLKDLSDMEYVLTVPETAELFFPVLEAVPLQLLAFYTALSRSCSVDKPRNLAKSVTVE